MSLLDGGLLKVPGWGDMQAPCPQISHLEGTPGVQGAAAGGVPRGGASGALGQRERGGPRPPAHDLGPHVTSGLKGTAPAARLPTVRLAGRVDPGGGQSVTPAAASPGRGHGTPVQSARHGLGARLSSGWTKPPDQRPWGASARRGRRDLPASPSSLPKAPPDRVRSWEDDRSRSC